MRTRAVASNADEMLSLHSFEIRELFKDLLGNEAISSAIANKDVWQLVLNLVALRDEVERRLSRISFVAGLACLGLIVLLLRHDVSRAFVHSLPEVIQMLWAVVIGMIMLALVLWTIIGKTIQVPRPALDEKILRLLIARAGSPNDLTDSDARVP